MFLIHLNLFCVYAHFQLYEKTQKYINLAVTKHTNEVGLGGQNIQRKGIRKWVEILEGGGIG
jgi:hypothetical protein